MHRIQKARETPLLTFIGMYIYSRTRSRALIDNFHKMGLSISYDTVVNLQNKLGNAAIDKYITDGFMSSRLHAVGSFTISQLDNVDQNLSSDTATSSFYETKLSLIQHPNEPYIEESRCMSKVESMVVDD